MLSNHSTLCSIAYLPHPELTINTCVLKRESVLVLRIWANEILPVDTQSKHSLPIIFLMSEKASC